MLRTDNLKILSASPLSPQFFLFVPLQLSSQKNYPHVEKILDGGHLSLPYPKVTPMYIHIHTFTRIHIDPYILKHTHNSPPS